ncbi:MAG: hypothetical protein ABIP55_02560 [Tepidisphaeraceae bacterium]
MNRELVDRIAAAVLYEGYLLYPYRPSVKNRQRWTFGGLLPEAYCAAKQSGDASVMRTECIIRRRLTSGDAATPDGIPQIDVAVSFLHLVNRTQDEQRHSAWQEAVEREVRLGGLSLNALLTRPLRRQFSFPHAIRTEPPVTREEQEIEGSIDISAAVTDVADCFRLSVCIANQTPFDAAAGRTRDDALLHSFASTHAVLVARGGAEFISMTDPPADCRAAVEACRNVGAWPILVGKQSETDTMLCSPIILADYPQLAPESPGDLFDGCEIDEILTLRIMALTDDEKRQMRATDARAAALLTRTEALTSEQLMSLHGTMRELRPVAPAGRGGDA